MDAMSVHTPYAHPALENQACWAIGGARAAGVGVLEPLPALTSIARSAVPCQKRAEFIPTEVATAHESSGVNAAPEPRARPGSVVADHRKAAGSAVELRGATKTFGAGTSHAVKALNDVSLTVGDNEFFTLLGPSGCGKTTLLRAIAGFEELTTGHIWLFGEEIDHLPPNRRPVNTVFQQYALFPHMTVEGNVAFGLQMLKRQRAEIDATVRRMLDLVRLGAHAGRRPQQLSGGQQQRVALARALATHPKVLLLDEPLSALDLKLRQEMRAELKTIQRETGITFIFVTHDQEEALTMSDRIAVMADGRVQQIGGPDQIYEHPVNRFVASFIGETNLLPVTVFGLENGLARCRLEGGKELLAEGGAGKLGQRATLSLRPEKVALGPVGGAGPEGTVEQIVYLGTDTQIAIRLDGGQRVLARVQNARRRAEIGVGERVGLEIEAGAARVLSD
jgi:spermidine/putrescine transport system ATP-binding protein